MTKPRRIIHYSPTRMRNSDAGRYMADYGIYFPAPTMAGGPLDAPDEIPAGSWVGCEGYQSAALGWREAYALPTFTFR